jgi:hypothetical protein
MAAISNIGITDKHYFISWSLADEQKLKQYTKRITSLPPTDPEYSKLADAMIELVDKRHNDHRNYDAELGHDWLKVSPINSPHFEEDMCTFQGINKVLRIYFGSATGTFRFLGRGTTASTPLPYSTGLASETGSRLDSATAGFHEIKGVSIRTFATYASSLATATMHQIGLFDASAAGTMLAIHDFAGVGQTHTLNQDSFSSGMIIDFNPFGDV